MWKDPVVRVSMEFECEDWDIGREASGLATSLFQQVKKKNNRKRKGNQPADNDASKGTSQEDPAVVNKKSKQEVPSSVGQTADNNVEESGGERLSKKERKNLRRKKSKLRRKLMHMAAVEADAIDGKSAATNSKKEIKLDPGFSSNTNEKTSKKKPKGKKKGKEKQDVSVEAETSAMGQSNDTSDEKVQKGKKRKLSKEAVSKTGNNDTKSPKKSGSVGANLVNASTDNNQNTEDSPSKKKKRKRISKKNKFKGYVKPERKENDTSTSLSESPDKNSTSDSKQDKTLSKSDSVPSSGKTNSKSVKPETQSVKVGKKKKERKRTKSVDAGSSQAAVSETDNKDTTKLVGKINKRNSLDPKVLSSILTSKTTDKQSSPTKSADGTNDHVSGKTDVGKASTGQSFLEKSKDRLNAARFRYLNEQLYTTTGKDAFQLFKYDKTAFGVYHEGFQSQVEKWPLNPIDMIIKQMQSKPKHLILADFGCGDAKLARSVHQTVHSFDLVALNDHVTVCDMTKVPLKDGIVDIAIFCLSLMGTNLTTYLKEANRVLKSNATLIIAEVTSRFQSIGNFIMKVEKMGFKVKHQNSDNKMFVMMEFKKTFDCKNREIEEIKLKPCVYKKR